MTPTWRLVLAFISTIILLPYLHAFVGELICRLKSRFE